MSGYAGPAPPPPPTSPSGYNYYGAPAYGASPAPPPPPPAPSRRGYRRRGKILIVICSLVAVVGLILIGVSYLVTADAWAAYRAAENQCEFSTPDNPTPPSCSGADRGQNIEDQTDSAYENATVSDAILWSIGVVLTVVGGGAAAILLVLRRMDRIESGVNPPE
jgi:hypothetical protein